MDEKRTTSYIDGNGNRKTGVADVSYNPNTDYMAYMQQAAGKKDYAAAGYYEEQRNKKIAGQGLDYKPTKQYADYYGQVDATRAAQLEKGYQPLYDVNTDYSALMQKAAGAKDYAAAAYYEDLRRKKIAGEGLSYAPTYTYADYLSQMTPERAVELNRGYQTPAEALDQEGYLNAMLRNLEETYQKQLEANDQQSAAQVAMQLEALERQRQKAAEDYSKLNRQLYVDTRQTERSLPERLAAMGYTGGASESALLRNQLTYEQALRQNEAARISGEQDIAFQGRQIEQQEDIARRQAAMQLLDSYQSGYNSVLGQMQTQKNYEDEQALAQRQAAIAYAQAAAETLAQYGDFSGYAMVTDLNGNRMYSDAQIAAMKAQYDLLAAQSFSSGGSGGGRSGGSRRSGSKSGYDYDEDDSGYEPVILSDNAKAIKAIDKMMQDNAPASQVNKAIDQLKASGYITEEQAESAKKRNTGIRAMTQ